MTNCNRKLLVGFLQNQLEEDDRLDFLIHLDLCPNCWEAVYSATKASHPHFYKKPIDTSRFVDIDLCGLDQRETEPESEDVIEVA
ncbi:MAG TPA: hypothetical protein PLM33_08440 [Acidobacteriota bacterium]|jgi:hypothetical protein|nr:hypothetical protein [Acidobacteriota bacterium]HRR27691.1 hypothetical protein [Acidobacteriota bacterium]HRR55854.1 hypothetical protein [Acidobacteriota bacterium]HRV07377.1 hypothetical protein [Acidobacteriota bacterium]